jgi:hypothetical protein
MMTSPYIAGHPDNVHSVGNVIAMGNPPLSDDRTRNTENESEASEGANENLGTPRSLRMVTATELADFFDEHWGMQVYVDEHPNEDCNEWFYEGNDAYDAYEDDDKSDFCRGNQFKSMNN